MGQKVKEGEDFVEMVTDKATFNVPSPATGVVKELKFDEDDVVRVGDVIAILET